MNDRVWIHHPESGSFFIESEERFYAEVIHTADGALCNVLGPARTGTTYELKQLLRSKNWSEEEIAAETASYEAQPNRSTTMSTDLMIPNAADVPAYLRNPELARQANEEASAGISTGFPARIKLSGKQFTLVDGNGDETPYPPAKLVAGPDGNVYLPVIVLRAKKALTKTWYLKKYDPNSTEMVPPDCFSNDAERPDPSSPSPQSETCATCPMNAFGSGSDQNGLATKGKACADTKILAVFVPGYGAHSFKIPPASLKNFGLFIKQLNSVGISLGTIRTLVGFDLAATFPVLEFKFGGYLPENTLPKLAELAESLEVEEIIGNGVAQAAPKAIAAPAPAPAPKPEPVKPEPAKEAPKPEPVKEPVAELVDDDPLGLGLDTAPPTVAEKPKPRTRATKPAQVKEEPPVVQQPATGELTDEQLMAELGL